MKIHNSTKINNEYGILKLWSCAFYRVYVFAARCGGAALMLVSVSVFVAAFIKYTLCHYHARSHSVNAYEHPEKCHFPSKKWQSFANLWLTPKLMGWLSRFSAFLSFALTHLFKRTHTLAFLHRCHFLYEWISKSNMKLSEKECKRFRSGARN